MVVGPVRASVLRMGAAKESYTLSFYIALLLMTQHTNELEEIALRRDTAMINKLHIMDDFEDARPQHLYFHKDSTGRIVIKEYPSGLDTGGGVRWGDCNFLGANHQEKSRPADDIPGDCCPDGESYELKSYA